MTALTTALVLVVLTTMQVAILVSWQYDPELSGTILDVSYLLLWSAAVYQQLKGEVRLMGDEVGTWESGTTGGTGEQLPPYVAPVGEERPPNYSPARQDSDYLPAYTGISPGGDPCGSSPV